MKTFILLALGSICLTATIISVISIAIPIFLFLFKVIGYIVLAAMGIGLIGYAIKSSKS